MPPLGPLRPLPPPSPLPQTSKANVTPLKTVPFRTSAISCETQNARWNLWSWRGGVACHSDHFRRPHHDCFLCFGVSFEANGTSASHGLQQNNFMISQMQWNRATSSNVVWHPRTFTSSVIFSGSNASVKGVTTSHLHLHPFLSRPQPKVAALPRAPHGPWVPPNSMRQRRRNCELIR